MPIGDGLPGTDQASNFRGSLTSSGLAGSSTARIATPTNNLISGADYAAVRFRFRPTLQANGQINRFFGRVAGSGLIVNGLGLRRQGNAADDRYRVGKNGTFSAFADFTMAVGTTYDIVMVSQMTSSGPGTAANGLTLFLNGVEEFSLGQAAFQGPLDATTNQSFQFEFGNGLDFHFDDFCVWESSDGADLPTTAEIAQLAAGTITPREINRNSALRMFVPLSRRATTVVLPTQPEAIDEIGGTDAFPATQDSNIVWSETRLAPDNTADPATTKNFLTTSSGVNLQANRNTLVPGAYYIKCADSYGVPNLAARNGDIRALDASDLPISGFCMGAFTANNPTIRTFIGSDLSPAVTGGAVAEVSSPAGTAFNNEIERQSPGTTRFAPPIGCIEFNAGTTLSLSDTIASESGVLAARHQITNNIQNAPSNTALANWCDDNTTTIEWRQFFYYANDAPHDSFAVRYGADIGDIQTFDLTTDGALGGVPASPGLINAVSDAVTIVPSAGGLIVDFVWPDFQSPNDDNQYLHTAGGLARNTAIDGLTVAYIGATSASIASFSTDVAPGSDTSKAFTNAQLDALLAAIIQESRPTTFAMQVAMESLTAQQYQDQLTDWKNRFRAAMGRLPTPVPPSLVSFLFIIPPVHKINGVNSLAQTRAIFENAEAGARAVAASDPQFGVWSDYNETFGGFGDDFTERFSEDGQGESVYVQAVFDATDFDNRDPYGDGSGSPFNPDFSGAGGLHVSDVDVAASFGSGMLKAIFALSPSNGGGSTPGVARDRSFARTRGWGVR